MKDLKDFITLEYELPYYVSTCGLEDKAVNIKSGVPGSNPAGVNLFFSSFFLPWQPLFLSSTIAKPQLRPLQLVALVKYLKDFISLKYELAYYVSTCGLVGKAVDIKSGDPGSNPAGVNFFFLFFASLASFCPPYSLNCGLYIVSSSQTLPFPRYRGLKLFYAR